MTKIRPMKTAVEKALSVGARRALIVSAEIICPDTDIEVKKHTDLGFVWKLIYWVTFIVTFGQVKMTTYGFVLGSSMYVSNPATIAAELVMHEAIHMRQREHHGKLLWYMNYLFLLPTLFTMRSSYERDAYTASALVDSLNRITKFEARSSSDPFHHDLFLRVKKYAYANIEWYVRKQFFGFGYFFMAIYRKGIRSKMRHNVDAALALLFQDAGFKFSQENNRFMDATNIVDAIKAYYK